jgi:diketogulonate reductase-like aldo/keto reductase
MNQHDLKSARSAAIEEDASAGSYHRAKVTALGGTTPDWAVGGGGWAFGWGPQDDADSVRAITHAVDRGVNWIDTASSYGLGHS